MATLLLRSAGAAIGTALGGPIGGFIGGAIGAVGGAVVDSLLINTLTHRDAPAAATNVLDAIPITAASEGAAVHKLWGRMRLGGTVIWCTGFNSYTTTSTTPAPSSSGKGFGGGGESSGGTTITTHYQLSFAVAFCEGGDDVQLGRVWADGNPLDLGQISPTFYNGSETQLPDGFMESVEGTGNVPAYRGIAYLVFPHLTLDGFGNRMPQITAEIVRRPPPVDADDLNGLLRSVVLLPATGEFVLGSTIVTASDGEGNWTPENQHTMSGRTDLFASLNQLQEALPSFAAVSLAVAWFGTDLRAGHCLVTPKVDARTKVTTPNSWTVAGLTRDVAPLVSNIDPATLDPTGIGGVTAIIGGSVPAYGGTPSDQSVVEAIQLIHSTGRRVMFNPFVMMDIPAGNGLPDPYGGAEQAPFPWRGRITCHPAPGRPGSVDQTSAAADQVASFFAQYRAMVVHYAALSVEAGGVDAFLIGSELVGLTQVRSGPHHSAYPAVDALKEIAATVKSIVGPGCKVGYAADWCTHLLRTGLRCSFPCSEGKYRETAQKEGRAALGDRWNAELLQSRSCTFPSPTNRDLFA